MNTEPDPKVLSLIHELDSERASTAALSSRLSRAVQKEADAAKYEVILNELCRMFGCNIDMLLPELRKRQLRQRAFRVNMAERAGDWAEDAKTHVFETAYLNGHPNWVTRNISDKQVVAYHYTQEAAHWCTAQLNLMEKLFKPKESNALR